MIFTFPGFEKNLQIETVNLLQVSTQLVVCKRLCLALALKMEMQWQQASSLIELYRFFFFLPASFFLFPFFPIYFILTGTSETKVESL